jgi:hypothetical protein
MPCVPQTAWLKDMHEEPAQRPARCSDWVGSLISIHSNYSPYLSAKQQLQASLICGLEGIETRDRLSFPPGHAFAHLFQFELTLHAFPRTRTLSCTIQVIPRHCSALASYVQLVFPSET